MNQIKYHELYREALIEVRMNKNVYLQAWSEIRAGHKNAVKKIVELYKGYQITYEEATQLIKFATDLALNDSSAEALFKSGDISERTYRMITGQYGSFDPLK